MSEDASKGEVLYYVYGNGLISQTDRSGRTLVYHYDYRGSTTSLTDKAGRAAAAYSYDTYGGCTALELPAGTAGDTIFRFCGRDGVAADSSGLYYMRTRCYSPELMRFLNADTYTGSITESATLNRYAYANGDPVSYIDPYGTSAEYAKLSERGHLALDMLSLIPAAGNVFDLANGIWYATEYDAGGVALSAFSAIPAIGMIGNVIKVGKDAAKGAKLVEKSLVASEDKVVKSTIKTVDDLINTSKIGRTTKGKTIQYERNGVYENAVEDFFELKPVNVRKLPNGKGYVGELPNGNKINVRNVSSEGSPTIEIQNGKTKIKFRYKG